MEAIELLKKYKQTVDTLLNDYFEEKDRVIGSRNQISRQVIRSIKDFTLAGGKRLRPALVYYGYKAMGGRKEIAIQKASMSIELIHSYLLIHDDVIDKDEFRHGISTVHYKYRQIAKKLYKKTNPVHFGNSIAITIGDMACSMGNEIIFEANFKPEVILRALRKIQDIVYHTIPGEILDVILESRGSATEEEVMEMYEQKTARYTFEGPLSLGAVLANAPESDINNFSKYAIPLGNAFQLRDDILGVFGDEKKLGKPVGSDIIEGKQTLLVVKALEKSNREQKKVLRSLLGKKNLKQKEIDSFRELIIETGSLDYAQKLSQSLVDQSIVALKKINIQHKESRQFLEGIAQFIIQRQH